MIESSQVSTKIEQDQSLAAKKKTNRHSKSGITSKML